MDVFDVYITPRGAIALGPATSDSDLDYVYDLVGPGTSIEAIMNRMAVRSAIDAARYAKRSLPMFKSVRAA